MTIEQAIKQTKFDSEEQKLHINLMYTYGWLNGELSRFFKSYKLSQPQYNILRILRGQQGKVIGILGITERMLDPNSNVSRLVEKLRQKELLDRKTCPKDRRGSEITITSKGLALLDEIDVEIAPVTKKLISGVTKEEASIMNGLLDKLRQPE